MYNYLENMVDDVKQAIEENYTTEELKSDFSDREELEQRLHDDLWVDDSVTGNASGSYYCNSYKAEEAICHNLDLLGEAMSEFDCDCNALEKGAEWCDVTIRCYLLGNAISTALDEMSIDDDFFDDEI